MKTKALVLVALSSVTMLSADYNCPGGNCAYPGQGYGQPSYHGQGYQGQGYQGQVYQGQGYQGQSYYQDRNSQDYNQNQPSYQNNAQRNYQTHQNPYNQTNTSQDRDGYYTSTSSSWTNSNSNERDNHPSNTNDRGNNSTNTNDRWNNSSYENDRNAPRATKIVTDEDISKQVHEVLSSGWLSSGYPDVTFDVNNGVVTLRGYVKNSDEKAKLETSIRKIDGVRQVNNEVSINDVRSNNGNNNMNKNHNNNNNNNNNVNRNPLSYNDTKVKRTDSTYTQDAAATDSDRLINSKIRNKLSMFINDNERIVINTSNGIVTITGFVENQDEIQKITKDAKSIDGVKTVNNNLKVQKS